MTKTEGPRADASGRSGGASAHLGIRLEEYDERIRTFVPHYDEMLETVGAVVAELAPAAPRVLDIGIGTGALSARCLDARPAARITGVDSDPAMLEMARARLGATAVAGLHEGDFLGFEPPASDVVVASLALHHVADAAAKRALYARLRASLAAGGLLVVADCFPPSEPALRSAGMERWTAHLRRWYDAPEAEGYLAAWAREDTYFPLAEELAWMREAGLTVDVVWRRDLFAVVLGTVARASP